MKILIVAATRFETGKFVERNHSVEIVPERLCRFYKHHHEIDVLTTGVGILSTGFYLGKFLETRSYDLAINAGICGAYNRQIPLGKVVHVTEEALPELGTEAEGSFITAFDMGLISPDAYPFDQGRIVNREPPDLRTVEQLQKVRGNTISTLWTDPEKIGRLVSLFPAEVETMEGAAFLFGCLTEGVPCLQVRAVSNYAGERDKSKWEIRKALDNLDIVLQNMLEEFHPEL